MGAHNMFQVFEFFSRNFPTSLVQDPMVEYAKILVFKILLFALKVTIFTVHKLSKFRQQS